LLKSDYPYPVKIGNPVEITINDFAQEIIKFTGSNVKVIFKPLPTDDSKQRKPDITKAREILSWEQKIHKEERLKITYEYFQITPQSGLGCVT